MTWHVFHSKLYSTYWTDILGADGGPVFTFSIHIHCMVKSNYNRKMFESILQYYDSILLLLLQINYRNHKTILIFFPRRSSAKMGYYFFSSGLVFWLTCFFLFFLKWYTFMRKERVPAPWYSWPEFLVGFVSFIWGEGVIKVKWYYRSVWWDPVIVISGRCGRVHNIHTQYNKWPQTPIHNTRQGHVHTQPNAI